MSLILFSTLALLGCGDSGPKRYQVEGMVTLDGKPLPDGEVIFFSTESGGTPDAGPIKDGKFSFQVFPGPKRVEITAARPHPTKTIAGPSPGSRVPAMEQYLPKRYNTASELSVDVEPSGDRTYTFDLQSK